MSPHGVWTLSCLLHSWTIVEQDEHVRRLAEGYRAAAARGGSETSDRPLFAPVSFPSLTEDK